MTSIHRGYVCVALVGLVTVAAVGCATQPSYAPREVQLSDNFHVYDMYDNSRDWGPSFMVGPPAHHWGDQARIDDTRAIDTVPAANPATAPAANAAIANENLKPLPPLP